MGGLNKFTRLDTLSGESVAMSDGHLIPVAASPISTWSSRTFKRARAVEVGEFLWILRNGKMQLSAVMKVSSYFAPGMYNPYTVNGVSIVNNVVTSDHSD